MDGGFVNAGELVTFEAHCLCNSLHRGAVGVDAVS